jgi:hypothetical protein
MTDSEQEALLLRQLCALRGSGLSQAQALSHAAEGLRGPLAARVVAARRALESGGASRDILAREADIAALDHAARAIDASLSAAAALTMTRVYLTVALAGPLVLGSLLVWAGADLMVAVISESSGGSLPGAWHVLLALRGLLAWLGIPAAVGITVLIGRLGDRLAPGAARLSQAAGLLQAAADGTDPLPLLSASPDRAYLSVRQSQIGAAGAAVELAAELAREGETAAAIFRDIAPLAATVIGVVVLLPLLVLFVFPLLSMASM